MSPASGSRHGRFPVSTEDLDARTQGRLVLGAALREAVLKGRLALGFQPQIALRSGALHGVEALVRWSDPVHGDVPAGLLVDLGEDYGLIDSIDQWGLEEACRTLARWRADGLDVPHVCVNVSPVSLRSGEIVEVIAKALADHGLQPVDLTIDITEQVMMDEHPAVLVTAGAIAALGVRIAMDDFGTGYSSLSSLSQLPIAELKIDRSFMLTLEEDPKAEALVAAVIRIGQSLGMAVVAEGVETKAQRGLLDRLNCDAAQGFLFARPCDAGMLAAWLCRRATSGAPD